MPLEDVAANHLTSTNAALVIRWRAGELHPVRGGEGRGQTSWAHHLAAYQGRPRYPTQCEVLIRAAPQVSLRPDLRPARSPESAGRSPEAHPAPFASCQR